VTSRSGISPNLKLTTLVTSRPKTRHSDQFSFLTSQTTILQSNGYKVHRTSRETLKAVDSIRRRLSVDEIFLADLFYQIVHFRADEDFSSHVILHSGSFGRHFSSTQILVFPRRVPFIVDLGRLATKALSIIRTFSLHSTVFGGVAPPP
jgi:hypothetical protein